MSQIKQVKEATDIVEIIGERLELQRAGSNLKANCPFHGEKTPSFFVNEIMQRYKCFGCGESGDVINFLEKYEGMTFGEALEYLAERAGIKLEKYQRSEEDSLRDELLEVLDLARQYYVYLLNEHPKGQVARDYLKQRGTSAESIKVFQLGYSLDTWDGLIKFLHKKKKYRMELLVKAGLVISKEGRTYDRFRGRLMFPLKNHRGQVVGFSGRVLDSQVKSAKYINSPETAIYHKSEMLYGFSELYQSIREKKEVVVAEGEFDVISSAQAHVNNVVAVKGSVLTKEHVKLISRTAKKVILALDRDSAGIEATKRAITIAKGSELELRVANLDILPPADKNTLKDPDDIARAKPNLWREAVKSSISVYEFLLQTALKTFDPTTPEGKREIMMDLAPVFNVIDHAVEKDFYVKKLAEALGVKKQLVEDDLKKIKIRKVSSLANNDEDKNIQKKAKKLTKREKLEKYLIFLLLNFTPKEVHDKLNQIKILEFAHSEIKEFVRLGSEMKQITDLKKMMAALPEDIRVVVSEIYLNPNYIDHVKDLNIQSEWEQILASFKKEVVKAEIKNITRELSELEKKDKLSEEDEIRQVELLQKIVELKRKK